MSTSSTSGSAAVSAGTRRAGRLRRGRLGLFQSADNSPIAERGDLGVGVAAKRQDLVAMLSDRRPRPAHLARRFRDVGNDAAMQYGSERRIIDLADHAAISILWIFRGIGCGVSLGARDPCFIQLLLKVRRRQCLRPLIDPAIEFPYRKTGMSG